MGSFELAAPLLVFGVPVNMTINNKRFLYGFFRFAHSPAVTGFALLSLLVLWGMSSQMYLGLKYSVMFTLLPGIYLALGVILWMQSLKVFPSLPNLRNHLQKAVYVFVTELTMMGMGGILFWSSASMNPMRSSHILWGMTQLSDQRLSGIAMMALSLPTMCLVSWHFWRWIEDVLQDPGTRLFVDSEDNLPANS
jgi:cytochrome c oxidase assembly factor CtaG